MKIGDDLRFFSSYNHDIYREIYQGVFKAKDKIIMHTSLVSPCSQTNELLRLLHYKSKIIEVMLYADSRRSHWLEGADYSFVRLVKVPKLGVYHLKGAEIDGESYYTGINLTERYLSPPPSGRIDYLLKFPKGKYDYVSDEKVNRTIEAIISESNQFVSIFTPYLNFTDEILNLLIEKRRQGVFIRIYTTLMPFGIANSLERMIECIYRDNIRVALANGLFVYFWSRADISTHYNAILNEANTLWTSSNINERSMTFDPQNGIITKTDYAALGILQKFYAPASEMIALPVCRLPGWIKRRV